MAFGVELVLFGMETQEYFAMYSRQRKIEGAKDEIRSSSI